MTLIPDANHLQYLANAVWHYIGDEIISELTRTEINDLVLDTFQQGLHGIKNDRKRHMPYVVYRISNL